MWAEQHDYHSPASHLWASAGPSGPWTAATLPCRSQYGQRHCFSWPPPEEGGRWDWRYFKILEQHDTARHFSSTTITVCHLVLDHELMTFHDKLQFVPLGSERRQWVQTGPGHGSQQAVLLLSELKLRQDLQTQAEKKKSEQILNVLKLQYI